MSKIDLFLDQSGYKGRVLVDDVELEGIISAVQVNAAAGKLPKVTLEFIALECTVSAEGDVFLDGGKIPEETARHFYQQLKERFES